jgi:hypothetical protein
LVAIDVEEIDERKLTTNSLMPSGLLDQMNDEDIASLFGFLAR